MNADRFAFGAFVYDAGRNALARDGVPLPAGAKALAVLAALLRAGNRLVTKDALVEAAWPGLAVEESNLSVQVANLRRLLGRQADGSEWIATVSRGGYRFAGSISMAGPAAASAPPVLAIRQLADVSGSAEGEALARAVTDDIAAALGNLHWFAVTRGEEARGEYRLEGSVRRSGERIRIAIQLLDATTSAQLFALKLEPQEADLFAAQDEIARRVAGAIEPALLKSDGARAGGGSARDLVRRGTGLFHRVTAETHRQARELFRQAARLEPDLAEAQIWLARVDTGIIAYGWSADPAADAVEGVAAGLAGVRLDENNPYAHYGLAIISVYAGEPEQAVGAAERAVELSDSFALAHLVLGLARLARGEAETAVAPLQRGLELSPGDPQAFAWLNFLALAQLFSGDADGAAATAARLVRTRPDWRPGYETLAACEARRGNIAAARRAAARAGSLPSPSGDALAPILAHNPGWAAELAQPMEQAGSERG